MAQSSCLLAKRIAVIACEDSENWGYGESCIERYKVAFTTDRDEIGGFIANRLQLPSFQDLKKFDGYVISGSGSSVNQNEDWIHKTQQFILKASKHPKQPKIVGICFGHQMIACALGGKVDFNAAKTFVLQSEEVWPCCENNNIKDESLRKLLENGPIRLLKSHSECISELPPGSQVLAKSSTCDNEFVMFTDNILGVQAHPEKSPREIAELELPSISQRLGWDAEKQAKARKSLYLPLNSAEAQQAITEFIHS